MNRNNRNSTLKVSFILSLTSILLMIIGILKVYSQEQVWYVNSHGEKANVRECPSIECEIIVALPDGSPIQVVNVSESWIEVILADGQNGHIAAFLTSQNPPQLEPFPNKDCFIYSSVGGGGLELAETIEVIKVTCTPQEIVTVIAPFPSAPAAATNERISTAVRPAWTPTFPPAVAMTPSPAVMISVPTTTPMNIGFAKIGLNKGTLLIGGGERWNYQGKSGEVLTVAIYADNAANEVDPTEREDQKLFDTFLTIYDFLMEQ